MKKLLTLFFTFALIISAQAATIGTIVLQGEVLDILAIDVNATAAASILDLHTTTNDLLVGTVVEHSNSKTGYTVTLSSTNSGNLLHEDGAILFPYSVTYGGANVDLSLPSATITDEVGVTGVSGISNNVNISYVGQAQETMAAGIYQDTLTFEIAAK